LGGDVVSKFFSGPRRLAHWCSSAPQTLRWRCGV